MRRFRVPTIPNMGLGLSSSRRPGAQLQASDSAIFADAEEESPRAEKRPSAPHMSGLRRRKHDKEEQRYDDVSRNESPAEQLPPTTTRLQTLTSLASLDETSGPAERANTDQMKEGKPFRKPAEKLEVAQGNEQHDTASLGSESTAIVKERSVSFKSDKIADMGSSVLEQIAASRQCQQDLSNPVIGRPQTTGLDSEPKKPVQKAIEIAGRFRHRLLRDTVPVFVQKIRTGFSYLVTNILTLFSFLKECFTMSLKFLEKKMTERRIHQVERENSPSSSDGKLEENVKNTERKLETCSTEAVKEEGKMSSLAGLNGDGCSTAPELQILPTFVEEEKVLATLGSNMTEEMMAAVPRVSFTNQTTRRIIEEKEAEKQDQKPDSRLAANSSMGKGIRSNSRVTFGNTPSTALAAEGSNSESSAEILAQGRSSAEDLMNELDQSSMRFEQRPSEIILSPLDSTTSTFVSDGGFDVNDIGRVGNPRVGVGISERPQRLSTDVNQHLRISARKRSSRGPTGKLKNDVRTMKGSLFRVFGRSKIEPETRFASPRSARKTLALVADMLVKEHGCDVAVRRNGALKMRCEKSFSGNQRLRVRFAFQAMDAFSCNVIVCRSREDDLQVSTTDYVAFVADLQRSFLNATSEGIHGISSG